MQAAIELVEQGYTRRDELVRSFFTTNAPRLAELCHSMARRFGRGGRLIAFGVGPASTDAQHVSVEFVHPVIVGKRALPAIALVNDVATSLALISAAPRDVFARQLEVLGGPEDIALGLVHGSIDPGLEPVEQALIQANGEGMLTIALTASGAPLKADEVFEVPCDDEPFVVQEIHETLYHVLWELVHVFFEHKGLLEDRRRGAAHDTGRSSFLYPFLAEAESGLDAVLTDVAASVLQKADDVAALRSHSRDPAGVVRTAELVAERIREGGKVLAFGNGGSATDAQDLVADLNLPPPRMRPIPALSLTNDIAVVTAVSNDVGFDNAFARQVIAYGKSSDIAVAISTSGNSRNALSAVEEAKRRGMLTVAIVGYGGGHLAHICDRAHVIDADYIPRIQEAQATQYHSLRRVLDLLLN
jgi:D-sedoheptulose 7-phosphate isomerase